MNTPINNELEREFSLVQGGPLFQLFVQSHLSTNAMGLLSRRMIASSLITWLPLLLLSAVSGQAFNGNVEISFLYDLEVHVRFLFALPLLLFAEWVVHQRLRPVIRQFIERGIITADIRADFDACIGSALRLRNSLWMELGLIALVLTVGHSLFFEQMSINTTMWYTSGSVPALTLSPAGYWLAYVSLPIYQFIVLRWVFRILIWCRFLWQVSRLELSLIATHPDRAGGLGFLGQTTMAFVPFLVSNGALLSGIIAERILYQNAVLTDFKLEIGAVIVFLVLLVVGPLCVFAPVLARTKRRGLMKYGGLASDYVRQFDKKWLQDGASKDDPLIGSADIQSLADLGNSFEIIRTMGVFPFTKQTVLQITIIALLPLAPLLLTMISLEDLLQRLIGILL